MNSSFGDNKKRLGGSSSAVTEAKRRAAVGQTWNFQSKQPKLPSAGYITTIEAMTASTLAYENARNAGVVPRIHLGVAVPTSSFTATVAITPFTPVVVTGLVAIADSPVFSVSPALPFGLSFSSSTGQISGTPMETISSTMFTVTVRATSIYPTPITSSATFTMAVGDAAAELTYSSYAKGGSYNVGYPIITEASSNWGTQNNAIATAIRATARTTNEIFYTNVYSNIAVYFNGYFKAPVSGAYTFTYNSDDGLEWFFAGTKVVNSPGSTVTNSGTVAAGTLVANRYYPTYGLWSQGGGPGNLTFSAITVGGSNIIGTYPIKTRFYH